MSYGLPLEKLWFYVLETLVEGGLDYAWSILKSMLATVEVTFLVSLGVIVDACLLVDLSLVPQCLTNDHLVTIISHMKENLVFHNL